MGIKATYYFRVVDNINRTVIMQQISDMGHEIGYHYEDMTLLKGDIDGAYSSFICNLEEMREKFRVKSICMHGSPLSKWDSKDIWKKYSYKKLDLLFEPYFDIDFDKIYYLTDAGRSWNNEKVSMRDKVSTKFNYDIKSTNDIIKLIEFRKIPIALMISTHPHNWSDSSIGWFKIKIWQGLKNIIKRIIIARRRKND